ncbi:uncharacterized protein EDB93DRAFT_1076218 [Suillus bovinus]|uniref:uncharacterized protein n=1 Tax=Suillus bovinus TaxID=48563 RepID=UPI001B86AF9C|nr:uncharacterized protein EDB93DRAFT_1076218 [Suillus bovinus]KAG2159194.1 hypothetical protein EDB93DRAFT_1076218 [Suillus bovinus]
MPLLNATITSELTGQEELRHYCNKCTRFFRNDAGIITSKFSVVVTDGVTIGHPCCAIHNCHVPLDNNRHHYCPMHTPTHGHKCAIVGCSNDALVKSKVCHLVEHKAVESTHQLRGQSRFQLQQHLQRSQLANPTDSIAQDVSLDELIDDAPLEEDLTLAVDADGNVQASVAQDSPAVSSHKLRAQFGRRRTHNEQLIIAPCGMILARETFYGAEGVGSVVVCKHCQCYKWPANMNGPGND